MSVNNLQQFWPKLTLVFGGISSGKSELAEHFASKVAPNRLYIATAQAKDNEMMEKIHLHQSRRGSGWHTCESPLELEKSLKTAETAGVVLVDCLSMWLSNHLLNDNSFPCHLSDYTTKWLNVAAKNPCPVICVSNDVGTSLVAETALGRKFQSAQGRLNQQVAKAADLVVQVTAGLPQVLKGDCPEAWE